MTHELWARAILAIGALVVVPLGVRLVIRKVSRMHLAGLLIAGALLAAAQLFSPGVIAAALALPWQLVTGVVALVGLKRAWSFRRGPFPDFVSAIGMMFLVVGGGWALLDRAGIRPLGFDPAIVFLTGVHFHYAGFALPILSALAVRDVEAASRESIAARVIAIGVIVSVPLTAVGITTSQLGLSPILELIAAWCMSLSGLGVAWLYVRLAFRSETPRASRELWSLAAIFLACGMVSSLAYGTRAYLPLPWLDIPLMRALHGTANALGFTLPCLLGWVLYRRE